MGGGRVCGDGEFINLAGVAVDANGNVYVADEENNRIQKFTSDGTFITKWGHKGYDDGEFDIPTGVAVDPVGNIYVADSDSYRIQKFTPDGNFITKWGSWGKDEGGVLLSGWSRNRFGRECVHS